MHTRLLVALTRFTFWLAFLSRRLAWHVGFRFRSWGKYLMWIGEEDIRYSWGAILFSRLWRTQIEIVGRYPKMYCGTIVGASFCFSKQGAKKNVVLHLNWIATNTAWFPPPWDQWVYGGLCDILVDPETSPLRELDGGDLWFMWPDESYGVIRFNHKTHLCFAGDPDTPRVYQYF